MPFTSSADTATYAARNLTKSLLYTHPSTPFAPINDDQFQALKKMSDIFTASATKAQKRENSSEQNAESNVNPRVPIPTKQSNRPSDPRVHITKQSNWTSATRVHIIP